MLILSLILSLTVDVEWYLVPSQVRINSFLLSPYFSTSFLTNSSVNSVNTTPFVFLSLIVASSREFLLIAAILEYFLMVVLHIQNMQISLLLYNLGEITLLLRLKTHQFGEFWSLFFLPSLNNLCSSVSD